MCQKPNHRKTITGLAWVVVTALVLCVSLGATPSSSQGTSFEYKVISQRVLSMEMLNRGQQRDPEVQAEMIEATLNKLGKEGWELLEINESLFILKRKLP